MSDDLDPAEPEVTTTPVVETAPFDGEFDADRARRTIDNLRAREKELEKSAKEYERLTSDPQAFTEFGAQQGWVELPDDTEEPVELDEFADPTDVLAQQVAELTRRQEEADLRTALADFNQHVDRLATDAEVNLSAFDREGLQYASAKAGFTPQSTEKAFEQFLTDRKEAEAAIIDRYVKSKQAPAPPADGPQGEPSFDLSGMTEAQARQARINRIAQLAEQAPAT